VPRPNARPRPEPWAKFRETIPQSWLTPFYLLEWVWEWIAHALSNWAFLEVLEYAGRLSLLVGVIFYFHEGPDRRKQKHYQAWQVINTAQGKGGSGGRIEALQELNHDHVSLVGVNVAGAFLMGIRLEKALLIRANFESADLRGCDLQAANLESASLQSANLRGCDMRGVTLENAILTDADLADSNLGGANLEGVDLARVNLRNCDLANIRWKNITGIKLANLVHLRNAPAGFVEWATGQGAVSIESDEEWFKLTTAKEK
jgi:pentapeptide repeat protein